MMNCFVLCLVFVYLVATEELTDHCQLFITVSSVTPARKIELNWASNCRNPPGSVLLFDHDPVREPGHTPIVNITVEDHPENSYKTNIDLNDQVLPGNWSWNNPGTQQPGSHCLKHWIASYKGTQLLNSNCLQIHPTWMTDNRSKLSNILLTSLFIPGTHNSACNQVDVPSKRSSPLVERWAMTQDEDIWNQLVYGIRYLDLRVGHYVKPKGSTTPDSDEDGFWINHSFVQIRPLKPVLQQISEFLKKSPEEVLIVDFHRFPIGFNARQGSLNHRKLLRMIYKELGEFVIRRPRNESTITLGDVWNCTKRLIVNYNQDMYLQEVPWIWNSVTQMWGDKQQVEELQTYLNGLYVPEDASKDELKGTLWAAMAELTHKLSDLFDSGSLRLMAESVNKKLSHWYTHYTNWTINANIVATDYFQGNNIVNIAINTNLNKTGYYGEDLE